MAFPAMPLDLRTELDISGTQIDVSDYVRASGGVTIVRGLRSEGSTTPAQTSTFVLNNRDYRFSPRLPTGPYYGSIGRNTGVRQWIPVTSSHLLIDPAAGYASCPDTAGISITGDIELRADVWLPTWRPAAATWLIYKFGTGQKAYGLSLDAAGTLTLSWSADGSADLTATSTALVPAPISGRRAVRATLDVNNGASGRTVTFSTAATDSGPWEQLGDAVVQSGTTSIFDGTGSLYAWLSASTGRVYGVKVLEGIAGTERANPDFTAQTDGDTSFADGAGNTWTVSSTASIVARDWRFHGEASEWVPGRDVSGSDHTMQITASGILRRLGSGAKPLKSAYYRGCTSTVAPVASLVAYWPLEDVTGSTTLASGISGGRPATFAGALSLASDSTSFACSAPLPTFAAGCYAYATIPAHAATGQLQVRMLVAVPAGGVAAETRIFELSTTGTAPRWMVSVDPSGNLWMYAYAADGTNLVSSGPVAFAVNGQPLRLGLSLTQDGADIDWDYSVLQVGADTGYHEPGTLSSRTIGSGVGVLLAPDSALAGSTLGHVTVQSAVTSVFDLTDQLDAYAGEAACARVARLCGEESIAVRVVGAEAGASPMGAQGQRTLLELLRECETTDGGILYEPRDFFGLAYRSVRSLCAQSAAVTLDHDAGRLSPPFDPVDDDQALVNDLTLSRAGGSSYRYTKTTGTLSTADPPDGVGVYDASLTVNPSGDDLLPHLASWRVHLGTVDEPRFTGITANLARTVYTGSATLTAAVTGLDIGDRVDVTNPPDDLPPDDIRQLAIGYTERLNAFERTITAVGQPESPYRVGVWGDLDYRWSGAGTVTAEALDTTETGIEVTTPAGVEWTHDDGDYDITVSGERMTVTAVHWPVDDQFGRTETSGWGTADSGHAWTTTGGLATDYYVVGT